MNEWIDIKDRLPENHNEEVLVYAPNCNIIGPVLIGRYFDDTNAWTVYDFGESVMDELVLAWMPLPRPPKII